MSLLSRGSIHQGHECFSGQSRGKQCSFMSLSALLTAQTIPVIEWNPTTIHNVLVQGDNMYLNAFNIDLIPREVLTKKLKRKCRFLAKLCSELSLDNKIYL